MIILQIFAGGALIAVLLTVFKRVNPDNFGTGYENIINALDNR